MMCKHKQLTTARDVSVHVDQFGCLRGNGMDNGYLGPHGWVWGPLPTRQYESITFCSHPCCEKVVRYSEVRR